MKAVRIDLATELRRIAGEIDRAGAGAGYCGSKYDTDLIRKAAAEVAAARERAERLEWVCRKMAERGHHDTCQELLCGYPCNCGYSAAHVALSAAAADAGPRVVAEHWIIDAESSLVPSGQPANHPAIRGMSLCCKITGTSWEDCMRKYHMHMGWEPYKPAADAEGGATP